MLPESLLDLVFPPVCLGCGADIPSGEVVCLECLRGIEINQTLFCGRCRTRMAAGRRLCHFDFPYYALGAAGSYKNEVLRELIHGLKFRSVKLSAQPLAELLFKYARGINFPWHRFTLIPVPLSSSRERSRGFNQSELIARIFALKMNLPLETNILRRQKNSKPQSELKDWENREENVRGCFMVVNPEKLKGKNIILVDDVVTSGSTLIEAARVLKEAGVARLLALVAARA